MFGKSIPQPLVKPAGNSVRFGQHHFFTEKDINKDNPKLLEAFKARFPSGSKLVTAGNLNDYVWVYQVIANTGDKVVLQNPMSHKAETLSLQADKNTFHCMLGTNLPLINGETDEFGNHPTAEAWWVQKFRETVDLVKEENQDLHRPLVNPMQLGPRDSVVYPAGFNLLGELFCLYKKDFVPEKLPNIKPLDGSPKSLRAMFLALTPESMWNRYLALEKPEAQPQSVPLGKTLAGFKNLLSPPQRETPPEKNDSPYKKAFWDAVFDSIALSVVAPQNLQRIDARGEYEKAPLLYSPAND